MSEDTKVPEVRRELAMITNVAYGYQEKSGVGLVYSLQLLEGQTVLFMEAAKVTEILTERKISNVMNLKGSACSVNVDEGEIISFESLL